MLLPLKNRKKKKNQEDKMKKIKERRTKERKTKRLNVSHGLTLYDNIDLRQPVLVISIASTQCKLAKKNNFMSVDPAKFGKMSL